MIPRIIHQTWKTETIPPQWEAAQRSWRDAHPGWEYRLWTDDDLDVQDAAYYRVNTEARSHTLNDVIATISNILLDWPDEHEARKKWYAYIIRLNVSPRIKQEEYRIKLANLLCAYLTRALV